MNGSGNYYAAGILTCHILWPVLSTFSHFTKWEFYLTSEGGYLLLTGLLTLVFTRQILRDAQTLSMTLCILLLPVSIITGAMEILLLRTLLAVPVSIGTCICTGMIFHKFIPDRWYKHLLTLLFTFVLIPFGFLCWLDLIFGRIGSQQIVQELHSPDGQKYVQLIDDDQGALGGNTFIYVRYRDILPLGFGAIRPDSIQVHSGPWGQFQELTLSWQDENTLLVNDTPIALP